MKNLFILVTLIFALAGASAAQDSTDYFIKGMRQRLSRDYPRALLSYQRAFSMEMGQRTLGRTDRVDLIGDLATCYRMVGQIRPAIAVLEFGISEEPAYPMFYYELARAHAELSDEDNAIKSLRSAFEYSANVIPGRTLPDPLTDASFKKIRNRLKFKKAVAEMKTGS